MKTIGLIISLLFVSINSHATCKPVTNLDILGWSYKAMMATHNYNFINIQTQALAGKPYFTDNAWNQYYQGFLKSEQTQKVLKNRLVSSVGLKEPPTILIEDKTQWSIQIPLILNQKSPQDSKATQKTINLDIVLNAQCQLKISKMSDNMSATNVPATNEDKNTTSNHADCTNHCEKIITTNCNDKKNANVCAQKSLACLQSCLNKDHNMIE